MHQDMWQRLSDQSTKPESQGSLEAEVAGGIRSFVANTLANDESVHRMLGDAALRSEVIDTLTTRAHGNFYCASVSLRQIKDQINISGIRETLRRTPEDIDDEIVQNVLHAISLQSEARAKLARRILALLTAAEEPMTAEAMCHALSMSYDLETQQPPHELDKDLIPDVEVLVKCCEGLISIDPVTRLVTLAQGDIAECMRRQRSAHLSRHISGTCAKIEHFWCQETTMLAAVSLAYLSMSIFEEGPCHQLSALRERLDEYPFLEYAARHWGYNTRELMPQPRYYWYPIQNAVWRLLGKAKSLESVFQIRDLDADVIRRLDALQKGKLQDQALDATQIRSGISALQVLSGYGLTRMVRRVLFPKRTKSSEPDSFGTSAIHEAARAGWDDIVDDLIKAGADPTSMDRNRKSPLYYAARNGCDKVLSVLQGSMRMLDNYYELELAFLEAIEAGEAHAVICLLDHLSRNAIRERSTILISIRAGHLNILEILLVHGADLSCPDLSPSDRIPLHQAIEHDRADMAKLLLDHGAKIQARDDKKRNAIYETLKAPKTDGMSLLLDRGIDVDCRDSEGNTVLHQAAADGSVEHARLLVHQGMISKTMFNSEGLTPLHLAVRAQQFEIVDILLKSEGVDVNIKATGQAAGWTPLMYAVVAGSLRLCDRLIQKGADVNMNEGITELPVLFKLAQESSHDAIRNLLVSEWNRSRHMKQV